MWWYALQTITFLVVWIAILYAAGPHDYGHAPAVFGVGAAFLITLLFSRLIALRRGARSLRRKINQPGDNARRLVSTNRHARDPGKLRTSVRVSQKARNFLNSLPKPPSF